MYVNPSIEEQSPPPTQHDAPPVTPANLCVFFSKKRLEGAAVCSNRGTSVSRASLFQGDIMPRYHAAALPLLLALVALNGCRSTYYAAWEKLGWEKRDILVDRVAAARTDQE